MGRAGTVGIVVPCHDVARYLDDCLDSLRRQTAFDDCTVVVVDDGSTDDTGRIAAAAAAADPRIRLISQPNAGPGPGAARNRGLDALDTEFVMFCDGDDELTPRAVELLRGGVQQFGLDLAVGASEQFPSPRRWLWSDYFEPGTVRCTTIDDVPLLAHNAATGNKLFRTRLLRERGWRFAEGIHHQDTVVTVPAMVTSAGLALVGDVVHRYRKRPEGGSIMDSHYTRLGNYWDHLQVIEQLGAQLDDLDPGRRPLLEAFLVRSFQGFAWRAPEVLPAERLEEFFGRARAVIRRVSPAALEAGTRHAGERAAYVVMREGDLAAYRRLPEGLSRVEARGGHLVLTVPARRKVHRSMLRAGNTRAVVHSLTASEHGVSLGLRIRVRGVRTCEAG